MREGGCSFGLHLRLSLSQRGRFLPRTTCSLRAMLSLPHVCRERGREEHGCTRGLAVSCASFEGFDVGGFLLGGSMNCREGVIDLPAPRGAWC